MVRSGTARSGAVRFGKAKIKCHNINATIERY